MRQKVTKPGLPDSVDLRDVQRMLQQVDPSSALFRRCRELLEGKLEKIPDETLNNVTIAVTSFLRPGYLKKCLADIRANLPECSVISADDGGITEVDYGQLLTLPFDSGLPAKRNTSVKHTQTKYWLCGCDDFDFSTAEARRGVGKMVRILDEHPDVDVASGRVNNTPYEGFLELIPGEYVKEHRLNPVDGPTQVDLTVNYFVARTDRIVPWDERMKIGGEHFDWFWQMKLAGRKVVFVPGVNIRTFHLLDGVDPRYPQFRGRANELGHKIMMEKWNIREYREFEPV